MPLTAGTKLGPYEIVAPLGAGGMGEVYRARDTRLGRDVAVKVLPLHLSSNPEVRARFEREAKTISSLNHPHVCTLFDVGREGDTDFLVMELIEGETLAQRLAKGALPPADVLRLGAQIADALDRAHRAGVIHRDLKPGNVMLTKSGAKLMDFGLARATGLAGPGGASGLTQAALTQSPTVAAPLTTEGTILGTFQYMAPEQLEGKETDARSDLWALGCVLYEMATGRRAFEGRSQASLISAIMDRQPEPISKLVPLSPAGLDRLTSQCLAKDPEDRWQNAGDLRRELQWLASEGPGVAPVARGGNASRVRLIPVALGAAALIAVTAIVTGLLMSRGSNRPDTAVRLTLSVPSGTRFAHDVLASGTPSLSPDATRIIFGAVDSLGHRRLWVRSFDSFESHPIPGTDGGSMPCWSPDGRFIAFFSGERLLKLDPAGGAPQVLASIGGGRGVTWGRGGTILFAPSANSGVFRISDQGGPATQVTFPDSTLADISHRYPLLLPDGDHFLFLVHSNAQNVRESACGIHLGSLRTGKIRLLARDFSNTGWMPGHVLFARDGALVAVPFDLRRLTFDGAPRVVAERVGYRGAGSLASFTVSASGAVAYSDQASSSRSRLDWLDRSGMSRDSMVSGPISSLQLSRDGRWLALSTELDTGGSDLWVIDLVRRSRSRMVAWASNESNPVWSPDGTRLLFGSDSSGTRGTYLMRLDGSSQLTRLIPPTRPNDPADWSADGLSIAYLQSPFVGGDRDRSEIWLHSFEDGRSTPLVQGDASYESPRFSPDGAWLAYVSNESGRDEVHVRPVSTSGGRTQISVDGGDQPRWRADGAEIVFRSSTGNIMAVDVNPKSPSDAGVPKRLFTLPADAVWDAFSDHQRFLVARPADDDQTTPLKIILGWSADRSRAKPK